MHLHNGLMKRSELASGGLRRELQAVMLFTRGLVLCCRMCRLNASALRILGGRAWKSWDAWTGLTMCWSMLSSLWHGRGADWFI